MPEVMSEVTPEVMPEVMPKHMPEVTPEDGERSGSVVECLTRDRGTAGSSLTGITVLWSFSKTHLS